MADEIGSLSEARVLHTSPEELCDFFVEKYRVEPRVMDGSEIQADYGDAQIDVSQSIDYAALDQSRPTRVTGTQGSTRLCHFSTIRPGGYGLRLNTCS